MTKKALVKGALMIATCGTLLTLQGCLGATIQRILVAVMFD
ncbi:MAG: hypothetical protein CHACPFDD_00809 [Phycisphaerae bacterium]|nr:hypothetical protein [Phycisphaerae bacterium]